MSFLKPACLFFVCMLGVGSSCVCQCREARGLAFRISFSHVVLRIEHRDLPALASQGLKLKVCGTAHGRRLASS